MIKFIGICVIISVCTLLGVCFSMRLKARQRRLGRLCVFIEELENGIAGGVELGRIIDAKGEAAGVFRSGFNTQFSVDGLKKEDTDMLEDFFSVLGMGDVSSQIKRCETYLSLLKKQESAAALDVKERATLMSKLGFFAGLFTAVLLI